MPGWARKRAATAATANGILFIKLSFNNPHLGSRYGRKKAPASLGRSSSRPDGEKSPIPRSLRGNCHPLSTTAAQNCGAQRSLDHLEDANRRKIRQTPENGGASSCDKKRHRCGRTCGVKRLAIASRDNRHHRRSWWQQHQLRCALGPISQRQGSCTNCRTM